MTQEQIADVIRIHLVDVDQRKLVERVYGSVEDAGCRHTYERFRIMKDPEWSNWRYRGTVMLD